MGYRCAGLLAQLGEPVVVIAREFDEWRLPAGRCCTVCPGDVHDEAVLRRAGIERARALIVAGDDDVANVSICLGARRLNPRLVLVARLFDQALAAHLEQAVPINRVLSTSALAAPAFAAATLGGAVRGSFAVGGTQFRVEERLVGDLHAPVQTVGQYLASATLVVLALQRGTVVTPSPAASRMQKAMIEPRNATSRRCSFVMPWVMPRNSALISTGSATTSSVAMAEVMKSASMMPC